MATLYYSMRLDDPRVASCWVPSANGGTACGGNALPDSFDVAAFREECQELMPGAAAVLQQLSHASQLQLGSYSDVLMPWFDGSSGRVVAIGDHAHATSPQLGQGANLALVDALTLADALADAGAGAPPAAADARRAAVRTALRAYTRARRVRIHFYQLQSRLLTPLFASPSTAVAAVRDVAMPLACSWGPTLRRHSKYSTRRRKRGLRCGAIVGIVVGGGGAYAVVSGRRASLHASPNPTPHPSPSP